MKKVILLDQRFFKEEERMLIYNLAKINTSSTPMLCEVLIVDFPVTDPSMIRIFDL